MNNLPREILHQILKKYGSGIANDPRRCENLLNDLCGSERREINVLVNAVEERVPLDLLAGAGSMPTELLLTRLEKQLEEQTAMTGEAARWAVESWAFALDLVTETDIARRQKKIEVAVPPVSKTERIVPTGPADNSNNVSNTNNANQVQTPTRLPTIQPPPRPAPPVIRQPPTAAKSPTILPPNNPAARQLPTARRSLGFFRGCLIVIFLLAAVSVTLFFGVPYAIEVMRETQRQNNSEPPRFPVR